MKGQKYDTKKQRELPDHSGSLIVTSPFNKQDLTPQGSWPTELFK